MKKIVLILGICFIPMLALHAQNHVVLDEHAKLVTLSGHFHAVEVSDGMRVMISQSDTESMAVSTENPECLQAIDYTIRDGVLKIGYRRITTCAYRKTKPVLYLSFQQLSSLDIQNGSFVKLIDSAVSDRFELNVNSGSRFSGNLETGHLVLNLAGGSSVKIGGNAAVLEISARGASDVSGYELSGDSVNVYAAGASDIEITSIESLNAVAAGASHISYKGNPSVEKKHSSGASHIKQVE